MKKKAFTLAEVLITLGIIGVVAAMTLPTFIRNHQTKVTVSKLKKTYSILQQAYSFAVKEYDTPNHWGITSRDNATAIMVRDRLFSNVKTMHRCDNMASANTCDISTSYKKLSGENFSDGSTAAGLSLVDGISVFLITNHSGITNRGNNNLLKKVYALIYVDINGTKGFNTMGKDLFLFYLSENGIIPAGTSEEAITESTFNTFDSCNLNGNGQGCTAWVIYNENQDYLKCNDLSWTGKHRCN